MTRPSSSSHARPVSSQSVGSPGRVPGGALRQESFPGGGTVNLVNVKTRRPLVLMLWFAPAGDGGSPSCLPVRHRHPHLGHGSRGREDGDPSLEPSSRPTRA